MKEENNECNKCGTCCKTIFIPLTLISNEMFALLKMRKGIRIFENCIALKAPCKHLTENNLCSIQDNKPRLCSEETCWTDTHCKELQELKNEGF